MRTLLILAALAPLAGAQTVCQPTPAWSPCEIAFDLTAQDAAAHPNPYLTVQLEAEFRSPRYRTFRMPAFWDGGQRLTIRFTPTDPGQWIFRLTSNISRFDGKEGSFAATESQAKGFVRPANVHHWARVDDTIRTPHLWMGDTLYTLPYIERPLFDQVLAARTAQKFTHLRGIVLPPHGRSGGVFPSADKPDPAAFRELDSRVLALNRAGLVADLILAYDVRQLTTVFPDARQRERYVQYLVARYAAMDVAWQGLETFEDSLDGRALLREIGLALKKLDPYQHPRSTGAAVTSSPLTGDQWLNYIACRSASNDLGAIEHQLYTMPQVDLAAAPETGAPDSADAFRHRLWNAAVNGEYPTFQHVATRGGDSPVDPKRLDSPAARQMAIWFDFFSRTRHWEIEPFFDVDGGRGIALEGVEYIIYVEKPGPVEAIVEKHGYDMAWFNPITGEYLRDKKGFKGDHFAGEPPDRSHDWVLHLSREGTKESMLRSVKFDSRPVPVQEIEQDARKAPFEIVEPSADAVSIAKPPKYAARITRENRATRQMMFLWTGEVTADELGARVIGTGAEGTFSVPPAISRSLPAPLAVRLFGMNAHGKVYSLIKVYTVTQ